MPKTAALLVHLPEKTKYFVDVITKHIGATHNDFVTEVIQTALEAMVITADGRDCDYADLEARLWADHPADRFVLLTTYFPELLSQRQRQLWHEYICRAKEFWFVPLTGIRSRLRATPETFNFPFLREKWETLDALDRAGIADLVRDYKSTINIEEQKVNRRKAILQEMKEAREKAGN